jgi:hypothetical protein
MMFRAALTNNNIARFSCLTSEDFNPEAFTV